MRAKNVISFLILTVLFSLPIRSFSFERPRIGLETETAVRNADDQIILAPSDAERERKTQLILNFWQKVFGGSIYPETGGRHTWILDHDKEKAGAFAVDKEWASDLREPDGYEIVTPPLDETEMGAFVAKYDEFQKAMGLGPGLKTSQQFNMELRNLIPGFSLAERPSSKLGLSYREVKDANIDKVVNLFLYLEVNLIHIYAAYAPKRLGHLINYFAMPMIFEQLELLKELTNLKPHQRTYETVRNIFLRYKRVEEKLSEYGERAPWKYRPFNIRKFFMLQEDNPTWVYPALEIRIPDTPESGIQLRKYCDFAYALYETGSQTKTTTEKLEAVYEKYRAFLASYRDTLPFSKAIRIINQDMVTQSLTPDFKTRNFQFLKNLKLKPEDYPPFNNAEPSPFVSQAYGIYSLIGQSKNYTYLNRQLSLPEINIPWNLTGFSFGAEFEFVDDANETLLSKLKNIPFLEKSSTVESATGNREVITKPTTDLLEFFLQIYYMRQILGDNLKSIHKHMRMPKSYYQKIPKQKFDSWLARVGDWITIIRANYRQPKYAFRQRTQNRMQVDTPNGWIADDKFEYRGTMRVLMVDDSIDIETRGLMDGIYKNSGLEPDLFIVTTLVLLKGIHEPALIEGNYLHRLVTEVRDPSRTFSDVMESFAKAIGSSLSSTKYKPGDLAKVLRAPNLMLLPLQGFEYIPLFSGHDVKRMQHATTNWKKRVWDILNDRSSSLESAQEKFLESLKDWSRESGLENALFDSLLVAPETHKKWEDVNLPTERMHVSFLNKLIELQDGEFAKAGIELFLVTWAKMHETSFVKATLGLSESSRLRLGEILMAHELPDMVHGLFVKLKIKKNEVSKPEGITTNLDTLLRRIGVSWKNPEVFEPTTPLAQSTLTTEISEASENLRAKTVKELKKHISSVSDQDLLSLEFAAFVKQKTQIIAINVTNNKKYKDHLDLALYFFDRLSRVTGEVRDGIDRFVWQSFFDLMWGYASLDNRYETLARYLLFFRENLIQEGWMVNPKHPFVASLLPIASQFPENQKDNLFGDVQSLLVSFLSHSTQFGYKRYGEAQEVIRVLKLFSSKQGLFKIMSQLAKDYSKMGHRCVMHGWKEFASLVESAELSPGDREAVLTKALPALIAHYRSKRGNSQEAIKHLKAFRPYISSSMLKVDYRDVVEDFNHYNISLSSSCNDLLSLFIPRYY